MLKSSVKEVKQVKENNARLYLVLKQGKKWLYVEATLKNGRVVKLPIRLSFWSHKLAYMLEQNLPTIEVIKNDDN